MSELGKDLSQLQKRFNKLKHFNTENIRIWTDRAELARFHEPLLSTDTQVVSFSFILFEFYKKHFTHYINISGPAVNSLSPDAFQSAKLQSIYSIDEGKD